MNLSWNLPFFFLTQRLIENSKPDCVFLSVLKQGAYHLSRRVKGVRYVYEVHELGFYPNGSCDQKRVAVEKKMLAQADLITVTTEALKKILKNPPYSLTNQIEVIPLAVNAKALPLKTKGPLTVFYVGQLYAGQGVEALLRAFANTKDLVLKIVGGKEEEIARLQKQCDERVIFLGYKTQQELPTIVQEADFFVAPFSNEGRMPYVAHTKLYEYASWGRPIIAPNLPSVTLTKGTLLYEPNNINALTNSLQSLTDPTLLGRLQQEITTYSGTFSWEKRAEAYMKLLTLN